MAASTIYSIPGYLGQLQVAYSQSQSSPTFGPALPFSAFEYGGACNPRGIYLASGIPYPDVFPDRQTPTVWAFSGPARNDFNPWTNTSGYFSKLDNGSIHTVFAPGQLVAAQFTLYGGTANLGPQVGGSPTAFVSDLHWFGSARGQAMWRCVLVAAWAYNNLATSYPTGLFFRVPGHDTSYNIPVS